MPKSPTQNTLDKLRREGYLVAVTEKWNPYAKIRQDLFGFVDVLAVRDETLAIQATSYSNVSSRVRKIQDRFAVELATLKVAGWKVEVWGWRKVGNRWTCREVKL